MILIDNSGTLNSALLNKKANDLYIKLVSGSGRNNLIDRLKSLKSKKRKSNKIIIIDYIIKNIKTIITARPNRLKNIINHLEYKLNLNNDIILKKELYKCFGYDNLRSNATGKWINESLNIKSCLYCNSQYTLTTWKNGKSKLLYEFDHFFPKRKFPYLSVSFFNLIPVCSNCNRGKSETIMPLRSSFHPYGQNSLDDIIEFTYNDKNVIYNYIDKSIKVTVSINLKPGLTGAQKLIFKNHDKYYAIEKLYLQHIDIAEELIKKAYANPYKYKHSLANLKNTHGIHVFSGVDEINRIIVGNYPIKQDFLKRPVAKFVSDLAKELKLI